LWYSSNYAEGKLHGDYKQWYSSGNLKKQCKYHHGQLCGQFKEFNPNGRVRRAVKYPTPGKEKKKPKADNDGTPPTSPRPSKGLNNMFKRTLLKLRVEPRHTSK